jgi:hypothetical protein
MKLVSVVRREISRIEGAFYDVDPEGRDPRSQEGVATLWPVAEEVVDAPLSAGRPANDEDDTYAKEPPAIEEMLEYGSVMDEAQIVRALEGREGEQFEQSVL